jgi:lipopolysaccharide biosynthesis glycosyltransferase
MLKIFIGYDSREVVAYHTCVQSILDKTSELPCFVPLKKELIKDYPTKDNKVGSTEFSYTRFLVPYLSNYEGYSLYLDCDFIVDFDISYLVEKYPLDNYTCRVVKHSYVPRNDKKFLKNDQIFYSRKNWSSFIIFNNEKCKILTPEYVNSSSGIDLHQFSWVSDKDIGSLPKSYNYLVGENNDFILDKPKAIHFTNGGPWFEEYSECDFSKLWFFYKKRINYADN